MKREGCAEPSKGRQPALAAPGRGGEGEGAPGLGEQLSPPWLLAAFCAARCLCWALLPHVRPLPAPRGCCLQGRHHGFRDPRGIALLGGEQWCWQSSGLHLRGAWHKSGRSHRDVASRVWGCRSGAGLGLLTEEGGWQRYSWTRGWHCMASSPGSGWGAEGEEREGEDKEAQGKGRW